MNASEMIPGIEYIVVTLISCNLTPVTFSVSSKRRLLKELLEWKISQSLDVYTLVPIIGLIRTQNESEILRNDLQDTCWTQWRNIEVHLRWQTAIRLRQ